MYCAENAATPPFIGFEDSPNTYFEIELMIKMLALLFKFQLKNFFSLLLLSIFYSVKCGSSQNRQILQSHFAHN